MARWRTPGFVPVTALAQLLSGERLCTWSVWFGAHYSDFDRVPRALDSAAWSVEHSAMLMAVSPMLKAEYPIVRREYQNQVQVQRGNLIVSGRPDLLGCRPDEILVEDVKTGHWRHEAHIVQVLCYMVLLPVARPVLTGRTIRGRVRYKDGVVEIEPLAPDDPFVAHFWNTVDLIGSTDPPERVPSLWECKRRCVITNRDCPERIDSDEDEAELWPGSV